MTDGDLGCQSWGPLPAHLLAEIFWGLGLLGRFGKRNPLSNSIVELEIIPPYHDG